MISRRTIINLVVFFALAGALVAYGAFTLLGNPLRDPRTARVVFHDASGLLPGFSASVDGVVVGTVDSVELADDGVEVTVALDPGRTIPGDAEASVIRASAIGEQRVEFTPTDGGTAPPIPDGGRVPAAPDASPPEVSEVLDLANRMVTAIPADDLNTLVHESVVALRGRADDLAGMAGDIDTFNREFLAHERSFRRLLESSPPLLDALTDVSPELRDAFANTADFTGTLAARSRDLTALMENGTRFAEVAGPLLRSQMPNLGCLISDSADLNAFLSEPSVLRDLQLGLDLNQAFFGPIDALAVEGPAIGFPQYGSHDRGDQLWLRVQTLLPPGTPDAIHYSPVRPTPNTLPGAGCTNLFGQGEGPASGGEFQPIREDHMEPAGYEDVGLASPGGGHDTGNGDADPAAGNGGDPAGAPEEPDGRPAAPPDDERALEVIRNTDRDGSDDGWLDDPIWLVVALGLLGAGAGYVVWSKRRPAAGRTD